MAVSGSDDCSVKLWDMRAKGATKTLTERYQITAVDISEDGDQVFTGGIDNTVKVWDVRKDDVIMTLEGHSDTITGMEVSPSGTHLLTNSMDNTMRSWDVRPYAPDSRCVRVFTGHQHGFEKNLLRCAWSADGKQVSGGSSDRFVHIWSVATGDVLYSLPGHEGSVNDVAFHPKEPIVASASSDKTLYLGELAHI
jgi:Prp8 binding protein